MMARVAIAPPIFELLNGLPLGASTVAPASMQRPASKISAVTTRLLSVAFSAIQSSAASNPSETTFMLSKGWSGRRR